ncbi:MAG: hypothetical protein ACI9U6_000796 [Loktanella salsilacus]|jgi:hypothetical protein|uniref:Uncharacterized protein n=3 Tax=Loktanella salsilacus TaxID=195913 RepID=A0A1I4GUQ6_9RHOB|nr:DUF3035 domain-containing protein [Loktanella salsilacus]SFL32891.1 Protein of unknown function [Loktanella salsilacus]|tara:strand:- start:465 stop:689 length:225 start_codon:yes stop_codon:yes gene_type:complete
MLRFGIGMCLCAALAACSGNRGPSGPDESSVETFRPLVIPATNALPVPTPGGTNPADMPPRAAPVATVSLRPPV